MALILSTEIMHSRIATLSLLAFAASVSAQGILKTQGQVVAATGDQVPGLATGVLYNNPDTPALDLNGSMVFASSLTGTTSTFDNRVLLYGRTKDDLVVVARSGDPEPTGTMPGVNLIRWISATTPTANTIGSAYRISPTGGILLWGAALSGTGIINAGTTLAGKNDSALFWGPAASQSVIAQRGQFAPSGGSQFDTAFTSVGGQASSLNSNGTACFQVALVGGDVVTTPVSNASAWVIGTPGNLNWMLRRGDIVSVAGGTAMIGSLGFNVQMNELGMVLHDEKLSTAAGTTTGTATVTTATDGLLMLYLPGTGNTVVVREGDAAPGTVGASFNALNYATLSLTRTGNVCFHATLVGGDVNGTVNDAAIFGGAPGTIGLIAREGDTLPNGDSIGVIFTSSINYVDNGSVLFYATLVGPTVTTANDNVILAGTPGNLQILAREGDPTPGFPGGVFGALQPGSAQWNDRGQAMFGGDISVPPVLQGASWGYDPNQGLVLLDTAGDIYTTVAGTQTSNGVAGGIQFNGGDGSAATFNNNGDFVRRISTGNGLGVVARGMLGGLTASPASVSSAGGTQTWDIAAGLANAGRLYVCAGTLSGTRPGFVQFGAQIPLNQDFWFNLSLQGGNGPVYTNSWGLLDANGNAAATWNFPAGFGWMQGAMFHHACVVLDVATVLPTFVSQPASVRLY